MSDVIEPTLENLRALFKATEQALSEWTGEGNLQFPVLLGRMALAQNWNDKQVREADPFVRYYVRNHSDWHVTRGAHGGIMRASEKQKKEAVKAAKEAARALVDAATAAAKEKEAAKLAAASSVDTASV
jgi:hypothetical protein